MFIFILLTTTKSSDRSNRVEGFRGSRRRASHDVRVSEQPRVLRLRERFAVRLQERRERQAHVEVAQWHEQRLHDVQGEEQQQHNQCDLAAHRSHVRHERRPICHNGLEYL